MSGSLIQVENLGWQAEAGEWLARTVEGPCTMPLDDFASRDIFLKIQAFETD